MSKIDKPFTPVFDDITQNPKLGAMAGLVFGIVWRYCQMKREVCFASVATISKRSGVSAPTVSKYLKQLVNAGYLVNITPDVKGISHHYQLGDLADRYIKVEFGIELPQDWADELDDLPKSLEPPLKNFRTTSKDFDTKIVSKIEDKSGDEEKASLPAGEKATPKKNPVKETAPSKREQQYDMMRVIGEVCKMDIKLNNGRVGKCAKGLIAAGYTIEQLQRYYSSNSWWYKNDWRGKKNDPPKPEQINETIKQAVDDNKHSGPASTGGRIPTA